MRTANPSPDVVILAGRYELGPRLAGGGMGDVHAATDVRLARKVAVKLLKEDLASSDDFVERFRREALMAARLTHPSVARILDYGQDGVQHYIVMELVEGEDLARLLGRRRPLPASEAIAIAAQVCDALSAAHAAGFVHRDIKPSNVIVTPDGTVKVTDFGIARALVGAGLTQTGTIMGTAQYIAPEQARGEPAVPASDLYSVGVLLFQMLTGRVPFDGDSPVSVAMRHLDTDVPRPGAEVAGVPPALDAVVARATSKSVTDRFPDATQMAAALRGSVAPATAVFAAPANATYAPSTAVLRADAAAQAADHGPRRDRTPVAGMAAAPVRTRAATATRAPRRRPGSRRPWLLAGLAALVVVALVAAVNLLGNEAPPPAATPAPTRSSSPETSTPTPDGDVLPADLVGRDRKSVVDEVIGQGYNVRWSLVRSATAEETVLGTVPAGGSILTPGQTIVLVVSRGSAPEQVTRWTVEDGLVGLSSDEASGRLQQAGVRVGTAPIASDRPQGTVLGTWPAVGEQTGDGVVVLVVSGGTDPGQSTDGSNKGKGKNKTNDNKDD